MSEQKDIRTQILQVLTKNNIRQVQIAREAGVHHSTLSLWLQGKVKGHYIKIEDTLAQWLERFHSGGPRYTTLSKTVDKQFLLVPSVYNVRRKKNDEGKDGALIPIHFDFQQDGKKYKEQFCWNYNESFFTPEEFAREIITENPTLASFEPQIIDNIRKSIAAHRQPVSNFPLLKTLELDVKVGNICLKDRFSWDINDDNNSPEDFAYDLARELNLNGQFAVKIAHQIREQIEYYRKNEAGMQKDDAAFMEIKKSTKNLISLSGGLTGDSEGIATSENYLRNTENFWEPRIEILDANEMHRFQKLEERQNRYARRTTR